METRRGRIIVLATAAAALVLCAAGCVSWIPKPSPASAGVLVTIEIRGGMCAPGPCGTTIYVERDGRVHQAAKPPNDLGQVPPVALAALVEAIRATDFEALASHPFTGMCPTEFDGQEVVFEFGAPGWVRRIATCEVEVDFGSPLFMAVSAAVGSFVPLPTP